MKQSTGTKLFLVVQGLARSQPVLRRVLRALARPAYRGMTIASSLARNSVINRYIRKNETRMLHLGCGEHQFRGWLNTDVEVSWPGVVYLDATKSFPLPDDSFDCVYSEHMIEHLEYEQGLNCLRECRRVLKRGGKIRIATPDLRVFVSLFAENLTPEAREFIRWFTTRNWPQVRYTGPVFVLNHFFYSWQHRFIYDRETLADSFCLAGFKHFRWAKTGESNCSWFHNLERHGSVVGSCKWNAFETMVLEAEKA